jgi:tight adherence protein B
MIAVVTFLAVAGVYLLYTAIAHKRRHLPGFQRSNERRTATFQDWLTQSGMVGVSPAEFVSVEVAVSSVIALLSWMLFGSVIPSLVAGILSALAPVAMFRNRRTRLRIESRNSWPLLIEELRLQTGSLGRSIPVALFEVGKRAPTAPMVSAFSQAHREWLLSTDFPRAVAVLKASLADATADAVCETLVIAHELGGNDLEKRLSALIDDRRTDLRNRKEAVSRQAGARFARWFVLVVPLGMALIGLTIGNGRTSYQTRGGQVAVVMGIVLTAACWFWASAIMALPEQERVFDQ